MMAHSAIGKYLFVVLHRPEDRAAPPLLVQERTELVQRAGVDGTGLLELGARGLPFEMRSAVDVRTYNQALSLAGQYRTLIRNTENIIWNGVDFEASYACRYFILDVTISRIKRLSAATGGVNTPTGQFWLEAMWQLCPVST